MAKLSDLQVSQNKSVLAYGLSGSGKTVFACSFPGPVWMADFDGKISSAASFYRSLPQAGLIEYEDFSALGDWMKFLKRFNEIANLPQENFPYKTLAIDSISLLSAAMMAEVMRQNPGSQRSKMETTLVPNLKDYQIAISHFKDVVRKILSLKSRCNVVMTAHISTDKDEVTGEINVQPLIWGKELPQWLPMVFEEVYRCFAEIKDGKPVHFAQLRAERKFIARTQLKNAPAIIPLSYTEMQKYF